LKLRNAWIPPAVAQAPIETSALDRRRIPDPFGVGRGGNRALHQGQIVRPLDVGAGGLDKFGDLNFSGQRQQLVLAVEQA
jgi:hypothetical protein